MSAAVGIDEVLVSVSPGETRAALVSGGRLVELAVERAAQPSLVGNIYLGRVGKLAPGMDAAFVELGEGPAGLLKRSGGPALHEGQALLVQVTADAFAEKGPRLSAAIALPGHRVVFSAGKPGIAVSKRIADGAERDRLEAALAGHLAADEGAVLRTAAQGADAAALLAELAGLRKLWQDILARANAGRAAALLHAETPLAARVLRDHAGPALRLVLTDSREAKSLADEFVARHAHGSRVEVALHRGPEALFARHEVEEQIAEALAPLVVLPSGGSLAIGTLEALSAIDVNTARQAGAGRLEDAALAVNLEAAGEIARQVRLRNLAGLIVIDFVHMAKERQRARVADAVAAAFAGDPVPVQLRGFTRLGLFELTRKRVGASLQELLGEACAVCQGSGRLASAATVAYEVLRAVERTARAAPGSPLRVSAAAEVVAALHSEAAPARRALELRLGRPLTLSTEPTFAREQFDIATDGRGSAAAGG